MFECEGMTIKTAKSKTAVTCYKGSRKLSCKTLVTLNAENGLPSRDSELSNAERPRLSREIDLALVIS
jgi:hypothetical protein